MNKLDFDGVDKFIAPPVQIVHKHIAEKEDLQLIHSSLLHAIF